MKLSNEDRWDDLPPEADLKLRAKRSVPKSDPQPMYVRLPRDLHAAVRKRAAQEDRYMAQTIRAALRFYLENVKPPVIGQ